MEMYNISLFLSPLPVFRLFLINKRKGGAAAGEMYHGRCSSETIPSKTHTERRELNSHEAFPRELGNQPPANHSSESARHRPRMPTVSSYWPARPANHMFTLKLLPPTVSTLVLTLLVSAVTRRPVAGDLHQRMWIKWVFENDTFCFRSSVKGLCVGMLFSPRLCCTLLVSLLTGSLKALTRKEGRERLNGAH